MKIESLLLPILFPAVAWAVPRSKPAICVLHNETAHRVILIPMAKGSTHDVFRLEAWRPRIGRASEAETQEIDFRNLSLPEISLGQGENLTFMFQRHHRQAPAPIEGGAAWVASQDSETGMASFSLHIEMADGSRHLWGTVRFLHRQESERPPEAKLDVQALRSPADWITVSTDGEGHWLEPKEKFGWSTCVIL